MRESYERFCHKKSELDSFTVKFQIYDSNHFNRSDSKILSYNMIEYNTIQYNTIQYNTIQYNTIQYNTIQFFAVNQTI